MREQQIVPDVGLCIRVLREQRQLSLRVLTDFFQEEHELDTVLVRHDRRLTYQRHGMVMERLGFGGG